MDRQARRKKLKKLNREKLIPILPNLLTTASLILGLASITSSINIINIDNYQQFDSGLIFRKFWWASAFIGIAVVFDLFDGKIARLLKTESKFGASYDSLSDLVSFGVAPTVLIYAWGLINYGKVGLMVIFFYIVCVALRLARFNIQSKKEEKHKFTGLPSPMAAGLLFAPILLFSEFHVDPGNKLEMYYLFAAPIVGLIMVSEISYLKFPEISRFGQFNLLVIGAIVFTALVTNPGILVVIIIYSYFLLGIFVYLYKLFKNRTIQDKRAGIFNR